MNKAILIKDVPCNFFTFIDFIPALILYLNTMVRKLFTQLNP